jgi:CHAT domain-containing protein/tetratricopeptide (TPR) repeat protein
MKLLIALFIAAVMTGQAPPSKPRPPAETITGPQKEALIVDRDRLWDRTQELQKQGDLPGAIATAEEVLVIERRVFGDTNEEVAGTLQLLARYHEQDGDFAAALREHESVLSIRAALYGEQHWRVADARLAISQVRQIAAMSSADRRLVATAAQQHARAADENSRERGVIPLAEEALEIRRKLLGTEHADTAATLDLLASLHYSLADYPTAERLSQQGLDIRRKVFGTDHPSTAESLNNLGLVHRHMGNYTQAKVFLEEALAINRRVLGDHVETTRSINRLGQVYEDLGDYAHAESLYRQALTIRLKLFGPDHPETATMLNNLAWLYTAMGDYARAEPLYQQALAIDRKALGAEHPSTMMTLDNLGLLYSALGNYVQAESSHQQTLAVRRKVHGADHPLTGNSLNNLALLYHLLGDYARAEPLYQEALAIARKGEGAEHLDSATTQSNLSGLYSSLGDYGQAQSLSLQALAIWRKAFGESHPDTAVGLSRLAAVYRRSGEYARAESLYAEALAIRRKIFGENNAATAESLGELGATYRLMGDNTRAEPLLQQAFAIRRRVLGEEHPYTVYSLHSLAALYRSMGDIVRAEPSYRQALAITQKHLTLVAVVQSERQQLATAQALRYQLDGYLSLVTDAGAFAPQAWEQTLTWKGAALGRRRASGSLGSEPDVQSTFADLQSTASRLATLAFGIPGPDQTDAWHRQIAELSERKERLEADLTRKSTAFRQALEPLTAASLRRNLPNDTVLIDFLEYQHSAAKPVPSGAGSRGEQRLIAFVVRPGHEVRLLTLGPVAPVTEALAAWRAALGTGGDGTAAGQLLRKTIWEPIEAALKADKPTRVLVSPDGVLGQLPLGALPGRAPGTYLLEDWPIATIPSPQMLLDLRASSNRPRPDGNVLVLGDVNYEARDIAAQPPRPFPSQRALRGDHTRFSPLEGTRGELATIEKLYSDTFGASGLKMLGGTLATKDAVRREAPRHLYLHLATHGFFAAERFKSALGRNTQPTVAGIELRGNQTVAGYHPGLLSGLALAGANVPTPDDDGILTAEEVATLDLSGTELAVLSACETGLGQVAGGEGLLGLQRAFHAAGARTVIASLWKVDDAATRDIMERFYDNLWNKQMEKLAALREAQLWMLRTRGARGLTLAGGKPLDGRLPPYFWGAFVLSGDWR